MGVCSSFSAVESTIVSPMEAPGPYNTNLPRVQSVGSGVFPRDISRLVSEYLGGPDRYYVEAALSGVQSISLCLSQNVNLELGSCWSLGFLSPERRWHSLDDKIDVTFPIKDHENCVRFLDEKNSNNCRIAVEVLEVRLTMTRRNSRRVLNDVKSAIRTLRFHLNNLKQVIFSVSEYASCCFSLEDSNDKSIGIREPVERWDALCQIIKDWQTCWSAHHMLSASDLFAFYFTRKAKPASEKYLAKFVILINHHATNALFKEQASHTVSNKLMWAIHVKSMDGIFYINQTAIDLCHAIHVDTTLPTLDLLHSFFPELKLTFRYQNNPVIQRIVMKNNVLCPMLQLYHTGTSLSVATPFSSLIELSLEGTGHSIKLTQLNSGVFSHLTHLSVSGQVTGHFDSRHVPRLKTLKIELGRSSAEYDFNMAPLVQENVQRVLHSGRSWQFVASRDPGGWSLASYDDSITKSQDDTKEDVSLSPPHSLPLITELLLVGYSVKNFEEWQAQLNGKPLPPLYGGDPDAGLIVWDPKCVQKITAYCTSRTSPHFGFDQDISKQTHILTSLTCRRISLHIDSIRLPHLQSLDVTDAIVDLLGRFLELQTLSFKEVRLMSHWALDSPSLQSISCHHVSSIYPFHLHPNALPRLSFLHITPWLRDHTNSPDIILNVDDTRGLSHIKHVVFDGGMPFSPSFETYQLSGVSHLKLAMSTMDLPACWFHLQWECEILDILIFSPPQKPFQVHRNADTVFLPFLPRVKVLTVTTKDCHVLINKEMPELTEFTLPSPRVLGQGLKCPSLQRIRFTDELSKSDRALCLNPATYKAIGARPRDIIFAFHYEYHTIDWDIAPKEGEMMPLIRLLEKDDDSSASPS